MAMRSSRGAPSSPPPSGSVEEEIDPGLLDHIPDVPAATQPFQVEAAPEAPPVFDAPEFRALLDTMQSQMQELLASEFARVEESVGSLFADMEGRLADADAALAQLREENSQLLHARDKYERAFQALKELARDVEDQA